MQLAENWRTIKLDFLESGAMFADSVFVDDDQAYLFAEDAVVWDPKELEITGEFKLPVVENRDGGLEYSGLSSGRGVVVRGNRVYVATNWANWDEYTVSEDSLIIVIDTDKNRVIDMLPAQCPYLDVGTLAEDGTVYFSNWVYSVGSTLLHGKRKACAVRLLPGQDQLDEDWSLTFADVTGGHEGAAMRYLGDGKALISVYHEERAGIDQDTTAEQLADGDFWEFWTVDLESFEASPVKEVDYNAGGYASTRTDGHYYLMVPTSDYESTNVYEVKPDGSSELLWNVNGWSTELLKLR